MIQTEGFIHRRRHKEFGRIYSFTYEKYNLVNVPKQSFFHLWIGPFGAHIYIQPKFSIHLDFFSKKLER